MRYIAFLLCYIMKSFGYLFGVILALEDTHHDEVFIAKNGHVISRNGRSLCSYRELVAIARSLGVNPWALTLIDWEEIEDGYSELQVQE